MPTCLEAENLCKFSKRLFAFFATSTSFSCAPFDRQVNLNCTQAFYCAIASPGINAAFGTAESQCFLGIGSRSCDGVIGFGFKDFELKFKG
jgi:hypothetical protein